MKKNLYTLKLNAALKTVALLAMFFLLLSNAAFAVKHLDVIQVKGKVTDAATNETLPGVTVKVKGTTQAVATDANGNYSIATVNGATLIFSFIGYTPKDVVVGSNTVINVNLALASEQLGEVKITTALGISKEDRAIGYSVSTVKGASLTEVRQNSFVNSLEGRVAGVNVSGVATGPNGATNVIIRGLTSLTGNNQPLYILNGTPLVNNNYTQTDNGGYGGHDGGDGIGDINPDDIESVSILKGAAATALYGYRGANGVVIITTKKGKGADGVLEVNSNYVAENVIDNTDFQTKYGQGYSTVGGSTYGTKPVSAADALGSMESSWGALLDGSLTPQFDGVSRPYSEAAKGNLARFYRQGADITNTAAFSKSWDNDDNTRFSVSELQDNSYVPNAGLQRFTFNQNTNLKIGKNLTLTLNSQYNSEYTKNAPSVSDAIGNLNWGPMFVPPNINITTLAGPNGNGTMANGYELNPFSDYFTTNPYFAAYEFQEAEHRNRFIGSANVKYTFDSGYFIQGDVNEDYTNDRNTATTPTGTGYEPNGDMSEQNVKQTELNIDVTTGKNYKFGKDFGLNILLGTNYRKSIQEYLTAGGENFATPFLYTISNLKNFYESDAFNQEEYESVYASTDLSYKNFLYLTVTGRNDWYSTLAPGKVNYLYPSVSGSFVFSEIWKIAHMDLGKLRLSYAVVGGEADSPYGTLESYGIQGTETGLPGGLSFPIGPGGGGQIPNDALVPSERKELEFGTEMDFFGDRLRTDIAYYHKNVINDILPVTVDYTSGYNTALLNVGNVATNGIEVDFGGVPIKSGKFSWDVDFNGTYINSKVTSLGDQNYISLGSAEGDWTPDGNSVSNVEQVVGKTPSQIFAFAPFRYKNGDVAINKLTGSPSFNRRSLEDVGSAEDPWAGGITNTFKYGNLDFSFLIDFKAGGHLFSNTNYVAYVQGLSKATLSRNPAGYGTEKIGASSYYSNWANADAAQFVYSASFIKFRSANIGYTWPKGLFNGAIKSVRISAVCHNVFTIMKKIPNTDPESDYSQSIYSQGEEGPDVPYSRTLGFNLNLKF